ncbi:MAG TPA: MFS transporter [Victivallales bacterium]|nr:MFS transporter [Victivallales bacterium]
MSEIIYKKVKTAYDENTKRVASITYFIAILAGFAFPIAGIVSPQIAVHFGVRVEHIVFIDALTLIGLIVGNLTSGKLINKVGTKNSLLISIALLLVAQFGIAVQNNLYFYSFLVLLSGFGMGLLIPTTGFMIVAAFSKYNRSNAKLNIMNFFVGIGAFIGSASAGYITHYLSWRGVFYTTSCIFLLTMLRTLFSNVKDSEAITQNENLKKHKRSNVNPITLGVVFISLALILYVYCEYIITYWFSPYMQQTLNFDVENVGVILGIFWLSLAVGRLIAGWIIVPRTKDYIFIMYSALFVLISFVLFIVSTNMFAIYLIVILLGLGCSGIYPSLVGYGMKQSKHVSAITMSFIVTCGSVGGAFSLIFSATVGSFLPNIYPIYIGPVFCLLIIILIIINRLKFRTEDTKPSI